jgi:hypothetical protein
MGLRSDHQAGPLYGVKGETPVVPAPGQRFACPMMSTVTHQGALRFMLFTKRFTAPRMIEFPQRLVRGVGHKVFLILDQPPVHKPRPVTRCLKEHENEMEVYFIPGDSPELNPDAYSSQAVKSNAVGRQRPPDKQTMMDRVRACLPNPRKQPQVVRNDFKHPDVAYAAA